jgi:transcription elongation GreA/GreB family factor
MRRADSSISPMAKALTKAREGDTVTLRTPRRQRPSRS